MRLIADEVALAEAVAEDGLVPIDLAGQGAGVGVNEEFRCVEAVAVLRFPRAVDAVAVALSGADAGQEAVPDVGGGFAQGHAALVLAVLVK